MDEQEVIPTTQEHHRLANQLMLKLGFEWNEDKERWYPHFNFLIQGEVVNVVKDLLNEDQSHDK